MRNLILAALAAAGLSACATGVMSEKQCLAGDWYGEGFADGAAGKLPGIFGERALACQEFNIAADEEAYFAGRRAGLSDLCTARGGYDFGRGGNTYYGVCPRERDEEFLSGYLDGQRIFVAEAERAQAQAAYDNAVETVESYENDIRRARRIIADEESTAEEIAKARDRIEKARDRLPYSEREVEDTLYALGRADEAMEQTVTGAAAWRRSDEFLNLRAILLEAHELARGLEAVAFCGDDFDGFYPRCEVYLGAEIVDSDTGDLCTAGPGDIRFVRRTQLRDGGQASGAVHAYDFHPAVSDRGNVSRRPQGGFDAYFNANRSLRTIGCSQLP